MDFKADIKPEAAEVVTGIAAIVAKYPELNVTVEGHTGCLNGRGCQTADCTNQALAAARIGNVVAAMKGAGGCSNEFSIKGWECKHPEIKAKKAVRISASCNTF